MGRAAEERSDFRQGIEPVDSSKKTGVRLPRGFCLSGAKSEFPQDIEAQTLKIGSRIPVSIEDKKIEYLEVGTSIWCRLEERGNELLLNVRAEISNFATPGQAGQTDRPVLRQLSIDGSTVAEPGKPVILGTVQDPNSNRSYQLQVTATKLR